MSSPKVVDHHIKMSYLVRISSLKQVIEFEEASAVTAPTTSASLMESRLGGRIFAFET